LAAVHRTSPEHVRFLLATRFALSKPAYRIAGNHILDLVVPDITNPFFVEALRGTEDETIKDGSSI
jgi:DNA-binding LacI/PurR family transcriptional regulator